VEREIEPARVFFNGREPYLLSAVWTVGVDWEEHSASFRLSEWGSYECGRRNDAVDMRTTAAARSACFGHRRRQEIRGGPGAAAHRLNRLRHYLGLPAARLRIVT
jgi:hypothetical protein